LSSIYNDKEIEKEIQNLNNNELSEVLKNLTHGVPIATPFLMELALKMLQVC
jgi:hypothetical protein